MDQDGDFSAYASARWGNLVRSAVVLGCTLDEAHDLVQTTLLRCYTSWGRVQRADNREANAIRRERPQKTLAVPPSMRNVATVHGWLTSTDTASGILKRKAWRLCAPH